MNTATRQTVLFVLLLVVAGAFGYDRFVAKKTQVRMMDDLSEMSDSGEDYTEDRISKLFNSQGTVYSESEASKWVKYSVMRPTLFQTYDVFVRYKKIKDQYVMIDKRDVPPDSAEANAPIKVDSGIVNYTDPNARDSAPPVPPVPGGRNDTNAKDTNAKDTNAKDSDKSNESTKTDDSKKADEGGKSDGGE